MPDNPQPNQPDQAQPQQPPPKSIDGVKPVPKLSGENQEHHLGPTQDPKQQSVPPQPQDQPQTPPKNNNSAQAQPASAGQQKPRPKKLPEESGSTHKKFPYAAVTLAVIVGSALIGLAVYLQLNPGA